MNASGRSLLEVDHVDKWFGGVQALSDVTLRIQTGEVVGLVGPNGSGKSTLVNVIAGVYAPERGDLRFDGESLRGLPVPARTRLGIARTFQTPRIFSAMNVIENVMVGSLAKGATVSEARRKAEQLLSFFDMDDLALVKGGKLTIEQRHRLEMARCLATDPRLLLLDEAMAGLNPREIEEAISLIRRVHETGVTIVVIEHVMQVILNLCERVLVLRDGRAIADGAPREVMAMREVVESYLGEGYADARG